MPEFGGFIRVHPRKQIGFFQEIAPALVSVFFALAELVVPQKMFCRSVGLHDGHDAARLVTAGVEANNGERFEVIVMAAPEMLYASSIGAYVEKCEWLERATVQRSKR